MKDPNVFRANSNGAAFPGNAAINASTSTSFDGTELDVDELDQYMGFLQALMVESGLIPNGSSESGSGAPPVGSQLVQSLRNMIQNGAWNAHYNGTNWIYLTAAKAFRFVIDDVNERIRFDYAVAGAAGGIITWLNGPYIDATDLVLPTGGLVNTEGLAMYACRAWVNFNGTGTVAIRASQNVTSITDNGTGNYTVNITNAMPDADYAVSILISPNYGAPGGGPNYTSFTTDGSTEQAPTTTTFRFITYVINASPVDAKYVNCAIFR